MIGLKKNLNKCGFFGNCDQDLQCMQTKIPECLHTFCLAMQTHATKPLMHSFSAEELLVTLLCNSTWSANLRLSCCSS